MNKCIYTKKEIPEATFSSKEHIFPKSIGGNMCLPRGYVSDEVNNYFSEAELKFAREYPAVFISRMFNPETGRKHHKKRKKITIFNDDTDIALGFIENKNPISLNQLIIHSDRHSTDNENSLEYRILLTPEPNKSTNELLNEFLSSLKKFEKHDSIIKQDLIPEKTYILGTINGEWYLGLSKNSKCENIDFIIQKLIQPIISKINYEPDQLNSCKSKSCKITANYDVLVNIEETIRVYAKITFNVLAKIKGQDFVLDSKFDKIRNAILAENGILDFIYSIPPSIDLKFLSTCIHNKVIGEQSHYVIFFSHQNYLYAGITIYGADNLIIFKMCSCSESIIDFYICDWQNKKEYTMEEYLKLIYHH